MHLLKRYQDQLAAFGLGYFFGLGVLTLLHFFVRWPATYDQAALYALLPAFGALATRLSRGSASSRDGG